MGNKKKKPVCYDIIFVCQLPLRILEKIERYSIKQANWFGYALDMEVLMDSKIKDILGSGDVGLIPHSFYRKWLENEMGSEIVDLLGDAYMAGIPAGIYKKWLESEG